MSDYATTITQLSSKGSNRFETHLSSALSPSTQSHLFHAVREMQEDLSLPEHFVDFPIQPDRQFRILSSDYTMAEIQYKPVASGSNGSSRENSLEVKRNEAMTEPSNEVDGEHEGRFRWRRVLSAARRLRRVNIFTAFVILMLFMALFNLKFQRTPLPSESELGPPNPDYKRIAKVSMLFGEPNEAYERALKSHERHAVRWGYPFYVLKKDEGCGFWTKLVYMMSVLGLELQKDPGERAEWLMWSDADSVILNPNIPVSIFLPPDDIPHVHFVGTRDWNGLNNGVFFLRVHPWSVSMLTSAMSFPICHKDVDLGGNVEQEGMRLTFARPSGGSNDLGWKSGVVYMPKVWFNTYEMVMAGDDFRDSHPDLIVNYPGLKMRHYYEGKRGDMLVHCPGTAREIRSQLMTDWMDLIEEEWILQYGNLNASRISNDTDFNIRTVEWEEKVNAAKYSHVWTLPLAQTNYSDMTTAFWNRYRTAMDLVVEATSGTTSISIAEAALGLRVELAEQADETETIETKIDEIKKMMGS